MSEEQKAIEYLRKHVIPYNSINGNIEFLVNEIILNLISKLQKENEKLKCEIEGRDCVIETQGHNEDVLLEAIAKKEKVIDLMTEDIYDNDNFWKIKCRVEKIEKGKEKNYIKEQFLKKVEGENE